MGEMEKKDRKGSGCSCSEARAHLEAFLDHECDVDVEQRLREHVASCAHCSRVADAEMHLREILRSRCAEQAPAQLRARVLGKLSMLRAAGAQGSATVETVEVFERTVSPEGVRESYTRTIRF